MDNPFAPRHDHHLEPHPKQIAFEAERVRIVLDRFGLSARIPEMMRQFQEKWGMSWLTFEAFCEFFPSFPLLLEAHSFFRVAENCRPARIFQSFDETFFIRRYLDVYARGQEEANGRPIGMVFPFDGYEGGLVMHNGRFGTVGTKMVHDVADNAPPHRVVVEPFIALISYLARGEWTPGKPLSAPPRVQKPQKRGMGIHPWIIRLLGPGRDAVVLDFFLKVLASRSGLDRLLIRVHDGIRLVAISQRDLAERTGLAEWQVKRAVGALRRRGHITTDRRKDGRQVKVHFGVDRAALRRDRYAHVDGQTTPMG